MGVVARVARGHVPGWGHFLPRPAFFPFLAGLALLPTFFGDAGAPVAWTMAALGFGGLLVAPATRRAAGAALLVLAASVAIGFLASADDLLGAAVAALGPVLALSAFYALSPGLPARRGALLGAAAVLAGLAMAAAVFALQQSTPAVLALGMPLLLLVQGGTAILLLGVAWGLARPSPAP